MEGLNQLELSEKMYKMMRLTNKEVCFSREISNKGERFKVEQSENILF